MIYAKKIKMNLDCQNSKEVTDINSIYVEGSFWETGWHTKGELYDKIKDSGWVVKVGLDPFPTLVPALSKNYEKYVHSQPNGIEKDNLLELDRV